MYLFYMEKLPLPVAPSKIQFKTKGNNKTINLINDGEVNQIKKSGLTEITFECLLPQLQIYPFAYYKDKKFISAIRFLEYFETLKNSKKPFRFKIIRKKPNENPRKAQSLFNTGTDDTGKYNKDTNFYVTLESYTITEDAKNGFDISVSITLKEYREYGTKKFVKIKKSGKAKVVTKSTKKKRTIKKDYKVKKGDTLLNIAKKELGDSTKRTEIYTLNKTVIENTARKRGKKSSSNGWWIFPGTILKLPQS